MKIHCLKHVAFESASVIQSWAKANDHEWTETRFYENGSLPATHDIDMLVILGGPMSANDDDKYSWMKDEKELIRQCIRKGKMVLGICLGSQLIASVLGAKVYRNKQKEIGWFNVSLTKAALNFDLFPYTADEFLTFHWHGDTFDLPAGAIRLASSGTTPNQGFAYGSNVIALQFHPEMNPDDIREIVAANKSDITPSPSVQSESYIVNNAHFATGGNRILEVMLDAIEERVQPHIWR